MKEDVHVADAVVPARVQVLKPPLVTPVSETVTVPVGVIAVPGEVSVTITVQVEEDPTWTGLGEHVTAVVVALGLTTTLAVPLLPL